MYSMPRQQPWHRIVAKPPSAFQGPLYPQFKLNKIKVKKYNPRILNILHRALPPWYLIKLLTFGDERSDCEANPSEGFRFSALQVLGDHKDANRTAVCVPRRHHLQPKNERGANPMAYSPFGISKLGPPKGVDFRKFRGGRTQFINLKCHNYLAAKRGFLQNFSRKLTRRRFAGGTDVPRNSLRGRIA